MKCSHFSHISGDMGSLNQIGHTEGLESGEKLPGFLILHIIAHLSHMDHHTSGRPSGNFYLWESVENLAAEHQTDYSNTGIFTSNH
jgi:hypothetical protein